MPTGIRAYSSVAVRTAGVAMAVAAISIRSSVIAMTMISMVPATAVERPIAGIAVIKVVPRSRADEHAANKPSRAPVTIWRASIRIVWIIPIRAYRGRIVEAVIGTNLNAKCDLALQISRRQRQNSQQDEVLEIFHFAPPCQPAIADIG